MTIQRPESNFEEDLVDAVQLRGSNDKSCLTRSPALVAHAIIFVYVFTHLAPPQPGTL